MEERTTFFVLVMILDSCQIGKWKGKWWPEMGAQGTEGDMCVLGWFSSCVLLIPAFIVLFHGTHDHLLLASVKRLCSNLQANDTAIQILRTKSDMFPL